MRASRLLSLLLILQTRGRITASELAAELEVSVRTVYRDVDSLGAAGVPVYSERGPAGGYRLLDGYRTRLNGLSREEAESLFLAGLPGQAADLGLSATLATAELKLLLALPPDLRAGAGRLRERFHLDAPGWFQDVDATPFLAEIATAVWQQRRVRVEYQRWRGEVERTLEPLGVVLKSGVWYLVARAQGELRTYRVSRVRACSMLQDEFERPAAFDLTGYWQAWSERFERTVHRAEALVRLSARGRERAAIVLGGAVARALAVTDGEPDGDGWTRAVLPIESVKHAAVVLLQLGAELEVLEPPELRAQIAATAAAMARLYGG